MKKLLIIPLLLLLVGCVSFSTHVFRTEQTAVTIAYSGYVGWTNYLFQFPGRVTPQQSNDVKQARLRFAATVKAVEVMRLSYETNSALKQPLEAGLLSMLNQSSNIVWLIQYYRSAP